MRRRPWPAPLRAVLLLLLACLSIPGDWGIWGSSIIVVLDFYYGDFRNQAFGYTLVVLFAVNTVSLLTSPAYDLLYLGGLSSPADYLLGWKTWACSSPCSSSGITTVPAVPTGPGASGCSTSFTPPTFCCSACWPIFSFRKEVFPLSHRNTRILSGCAALLLCAGLSGCRSVPASRPSGPLDPCGPTPGPDR